jgi:hypothetical protein
MTKISNEHSVATCPFLKLECTGYGCLFYEGRGLGCKLVILCNDVHNIREQLKLARM